MIIFMKHKSIPNILTILRVVASPVCALLWAEGIHVTSLSLMVVISLSDGLDGYLARRLDAQSRLGRILDPVADKVLVACMLVALAHGLESSLFVVMAGLILLREFLVGAMREDAAGSIVIHVSIMAKWKTALQLIAIIATMFLAMLNMMNNVILLLIWVPIVAITWSSALGYIQAWRHGVKEQQ